MTKKSNTSSASGSGSQLQSLKNTGQTQHTTVASPTLLPTPTQVDWKGRGPNSKQTGIDQVIAHKMSQYSQEASPANHSATLDEEKERQTTATSGLKCLQSLETSDPIGSSLRTCVASLLGTTAWYSNARALTWKAKVTKSNRLLFQLAPSKRRTNESECGLLPTAQAHKTTPNTKDPSDLVNSKGQPWKLGEKPHDKRTGKPVTTAIADVLGAQTGEKLRLQPAMTEWMMGFPDKWTELPLVPQDTVKND